MTPIKYRKKPIEIEAIYYNGFNGFLCYKFMDIDTRIFSETNCENMPIPIYTLEGVMMLNPCNYLIKGIKGEFYPCAKDVFEASYEEVE